MLPSGQTPLIASAWTSHGAAANQTSVAAGRARTPRFYFRSIS
jgi:hypothetical protein